jgi:TonB family protein
VRDFVGFLLVGGMAAATVAATVQFIELQDRISHARDVVIQAEQENQAVPVDLGLDRLDFSAILHKPLRCYEPKSIIEFSPDYPEFALGTHQQGYVTIAFVVDASGLVQNPKVIAEQPKGFGFADAAMKVFPLWQFKPAERDGKSVSAESRIQVTFTGALPVIGVGSCDN